MGLDAKSMVERLLFHATPEGYPKDFPVVSKYQIPLLPKVSLSDIPEALIAFDDRRRAASPSQTGLHFYRDDRKFAGPLIEPVKWVDRFASFKCTLTPDVTIAKGMPEYLRISNTVHSRDAGAVWSHHGLKVIPSLRWVSQEDYDFVFAGIEMGSVVAVSNYGSYLEPEAKIIFEQGLDALISTLEPKGIILFGKLYPRLTDIVQDRTQLFPRPPITSTFRTTPAKPHESSETDFTLFD